MSPVDAMSELLQTWLNHEVGLSKGVESFEKDFANGFLFGELLQKYKQQDDFVSFENKNTYEAKHNNFKRLEPTFKALGIKFSAAQGKAMMDGERGASLRLLYQLKMATERLLLSVDHVQDGDKQEKTGGLASVTKSIRIPRDKFDAHEKGFFESRLRATSQNIKQMRIDKLLKPFEEEKHAQETLAMEMDRIDQGRIMEQRDYNRKVLREKMKKNQSFLQEWHEKGIQAWEQNQRVKAVREGREVAFENRMVQRQSDARERVRGGAASEVRDGIDIFEKSLAKLGFIHDREDIQKATGDGSDSGEEMDNDADHLLSMTTPAATAKELLESLQQRLPSTEELEQEATLFLQKIKESKHAGNVARKERERRRRRVLVEQQQEQDLLEEKKLEEVLIDKLLRESNEEKRIGYNVWKTQTYEEVIGSNRQLRQQEYASRRKKDQAEALERDQDLLLQMLGSAKDEQQRECVRYRALERGRLAERKARWSSECEGILELISSIAFAAAEQEQMCDDGEVDPTLWNDWMALFEDGLPVPPLKHSAVVEGMWTSSREDDGVVGPESIYPVTALPPDGDGTNAESILDDAELRSYISGTGQWKSEDAEKFDVNTEVTTTIEAEPPLSFAEHLEKTVDYEEGRPVNYRLGIVVAALIDKEYALPPPPPPPAMPEVPLRLIMTGKPFTGKKTLGMRLGENYNLTMISLDDVVRECLSLSKRPEPGSMDELSINADNADEKCRIAEESGNPFIRQLQDIGYELQEMIDRGDTMPDEIYVRMITTKIQSLFPDRLKHSEEDGSAEPIEGDEEGLQPEGWIVIGFPDNLQQYALFERFISGWVAPNQRPMADAERKKAEAALLAPKPYEAPPPFELFPGGVDLHFRLDVGNDEIIRRAVGRRLDPQTALVYHLEDSPPPSKKQLIYERLVPIDDLAFSQGSLTDRLHAFDVCQLEIEPFLGHFGPYEDLPRLVEVPEGPPEQIYDMVEEKVAELFDRKRVDQMQKQEEAMEAKRRKEEEAAAKEAAAEAEGHAEDDAAEGAEGRASPDAAGTASQKGGTDGAGSVAEGHEGAEGDTPFVKIEMLELSKKVVGLEDKIRDILLNQWEELQKDFKDNVQQLFRWHRAHLDDFRLGLHGIQQRFLRWVQRPDGKQSKVDKFVQDINAFSEEYPDMRKQEATKEELHCQADDLHDVLNGMVKERKTEGDTESKSITESGWVEAHLHVVASQAQRAVQLEASKYRAACQLLRDFYSAAMGEGLLEVKAAPAKIEALPAPGAMTLAESYKEAEGEGEDRVEAHWDFPFLEELMTAAKSENIIFKLEEPPLDPDEAAAAAAADPKAKAGKQSPQPGAVPPTAGGKASPLWVDLQQALIAEKCTYLHRLCVIKTWTYNRLCSVADQAQSVFQRLEDWVRLREKKELDAIVELINIIKEHIESEQMIKYQLTVDGSHLHRHPNTLLQEPPAPFVPPPVECDIPYRWSVRQLHELSDAIANAAVSFGAQAGLVPCSAVYALLQHLIQMSAAKELQERLYVPVAWAEACDHETLYKLCQRFDHPGQLGQIDCAEFLLHLGFLHSPVGWPSLDDLQRIRGFLEHKMPAGAKWPDFYIEEKDFEFLPLLQDPDDVEGQLASQYPLETAQAPGRFDRLGQQLLWIGRMLRHFRGKPWQLQSYDLQAAWYDYRVRCREQAMRAAAAEKEAELAAMPEEEQAAGSIEPSPRPDSEAPGSAEEEPQEDEEAEAMPEAMEEVPQIIKPQPPEGVALPDSPTQISVRQLLGYLALGNSPSDGLARNLAILGPWQNGDEDIPADQLYAAMHQLGTRPTPLDEGLGKPWYPSFEQFCEEYGLGDGEGEAPTGMSPTKFLAHGRTTSALRRLGKRFVRTDLEKLFPKPA